MTSVIILQEEDNWWEGFKTAGRSKSLITSSTVTGSLSLPPLSLFIKSRNQFLAKTQLQSLSLPQNKPIDRHCPCDSHKRNPKFVCKIHKFSSLCSQIIVITTTILISRFNIIITIIIEDDPRRKRAKRRIIGGIWWSTSSQLSIPAARCWDLGSVPSD